MSQETKVDIRPQVTMLSVLRYLEYEPWYALAEFVDNSIASFIKHERELKYLEGNDFKLVVSIELNALEKKITIRDNAAGINSSDYPRAFRAAEIPPDNTGLSEFGMGMKSASCWFTDEWQVTSTALGEDIERCIKFDMKKIYLDKLEDLEVQFSSSQIDRHYTVIELFNVNRMPKGRTIAKIKDHLKSIYRQFIRDDKIILKLDGEILTYSEPPILRAPRFDNPNGQPILWRKEVFLNLGEGKSVHGFVAIREKASTYDAGFALFRRGRVIEGSSENGFRPEYIFGNPNSFRYQRVFGELHLDGFDVSFTKRGIQWDENQEYFLKKLKEDINEKNFPVLTQADNYRARASDKDYRSASKALNGPATTLAEKAATVIPKVEELGPSDPEYSTSLSTTEKTVHREVEINFNNTNWKISIELSYDPSIKDLIEIGESYIKNKDFDIDIRQIGIRLSLTHPFMVKHIGIDTNKIESILRLSASLALAEVIARNTKVVGDVRRNFNELIAKLSED